MATGWSKKANTKKHMEILLNNIQINDSNNELLIKLAEETSSRRIIDYKIHTCKIDFDRLEKIEAHVECTFFNEVWDNRGETSVLSECRIDQLVLYFEGLICEEFQYNQMKNKAEFVEDLEKKLKIKEL
jgi:hypothetical protein